LTADREHGGDEHQRHDAYLDEIAVRKVFKEWRDGENQDQRGEQFDG
jgi:hypothetical protein